MSATRLPAIVFLCLLIGFGVFLAATVSTLPARMATHFDAGGHANGWMNRNAAAEFQGAAGIALPVVIATVFFLFRFMPPMMINLPHHDFWLSSERHGATCSYLFRQGLWVASLMVLLQIVVWGEMIAANHQRTPHIPLPGIIGAIGLFSVAVILWVINLTRHFNRVAP